MPHRYDVDFDRRVEEFVDGLDKAEQRQFVGKVEQVRQSPFRSAFRQLKGQRWKGRTLRRAKFGRKMRFIYYVDARTVRIVLAGPRSDVYRSLGRLT